MGRDGTGTLRLAASERRGAGCRTFCWCRCWHSIGVAYRVGYGAGYYDRTLAGLPGRLRLGVAYAAQELDEVPAGPYDERLDAVATERGVIFCKE